LRKGSRAGPARVDSLPKMMSKMQSSILIFEIALLARAKFHPITRAWVNSIEHEPNANAAKRT
jgi:hypothetical protein